MDMETLQEKIARLKAEKERLEGAENIDVNEYNLVCNQLSQAEWELAQQQETEQRVQQQEEKVQSITLPYDYNEIFDNAKANETIIELIQQAVRQNNEEHNAEIEQMRSEYMEKLRAAEEREVQLQRQNAELQKQLEAESAQLAAALQERDEAKKQLQQVTAERDDFETKLKNAGNEIEDLKREIEQVKSWNDDLHKQIAVGARNMTKVHDINVNDRLAQLAEEAKNAKVKTALELALEGNTFRGKVTPPSIIVPGSNEVQPFRQDNHTQVGQEAVGQSANTQEVTFPQVPSVPVPEVAAANTTAQVAGETTARDFAKEIDHINARLDRLEKLANLPELEKAS
jgi:chromosome segregation ATPase